MNSIYKLLLLCLSQTLSHTFAFSNAALPQLRNYRATSTYAPLCMSCRRDALKVGTAAVATFAFGTLPSPVKASEDEDISWTVHKGQFREEELKDFVKTSSGLLYKDVVVGKGNEPNDGDAVTINMVGYIYETGEKWTNTYIGIPTYQAVVRAGARENQKIMKGLNEGVKSMKKGGKRILVIPAYLAYNYLTILSDKNPGTPIIPGGSSLVCYVEVLSFKKLD